MSTWIIEPHEPLIFRDGRPFGLQPGTRIRSLPFPFPSTVAGAVRSWAGTNAEGVFDNIGTEKLSALKKIKVRGPLLIDLPIAQNDRQTFTWLVPVPTDFQLIEEPETKKKVMKRLVPLKLEENESTDLSELAEEGLLPVGMPLYQEGKPVKNPTAYWKWERFETWLTNPDKLETEPKLENLAHYELPYEQRVHISMGAETRTAITGQLFETGGLEFTIPDKKTHQLSQARRVALAFEVENETDYQLHEGQSTFGGERRLVSWHQSSQSLPKRCPEGIVNEIVKRKACRIILLTPAYFQKGSIPSTLFEENSGARLVAMTNTRPQVVSGWDMDKNQPKPTARLAAAGTVFFVNLEKMGNKAKIYGWIRQVWMNCISDKVQLSDEAQSGDKAQWRHDGFGLAVLGTWDGKEQALNIGGYK